MKILVIDDEKPTLSMFKLFLDAYGYEVYTAEDGETGLEMFDQVRPEIVFTDIKMPGIDGLEVLRRIRKTGHASEVIIITGHGDMEKAVEALDLEASDFINKPVERKALNSALARAEKRRQMTEGQVLDCSAQSDNQTFLISIKGRLCGSEKDKLISLYDSCPFDEIQTVVFRMDDSFSIDRTGISILTEALQTLKKKGVAVSIENLSYNYVRVFQMAGLDKFASLIEGSGIEGSGIEGSGDDQDLS